jgi:hypothetical protein
VLAQGHLPRTLAVGRWPLAVGRDGSVSAHAKRRRTRIDRRFLLEPLLRSRGSTGSLAPPGLPGALVMLTPAVKRDPNPRAEFRAFDEAKRPVRSTNGAILAVDNQAFSGTPGGRRLVLGSLSTPDPSRTCASWEATGLP